MKSHLMLMLAALPLGAEPLKFTACVRDASNLLAPVVARALGVAKDMFAREGVDLVWEDCAPGIPAVRLIEAPPADFKRAALAVTFYAPGSAGLATLFASRIAQAAARAGGETDRLLGACLAHELAHIVLRDFDHGDRGAFGGHFGKREIELASMGLLHFDAREARQIRARLAESDALANER